MMEDRIEKKTDNLMIEIRKIEPTKGNLKKFTKFQIDLYDGNPYYVPPLISDDVATLSPDVNPAFEFAMPPISWRIEMASLWGVSPV